MNQDLEAQGMGFFVAPVGGDQEILPLGDLNGGTVLSRRNLVFFGEKFPSGLSDQAMLR